MHITGIEVLPCWNGPRVDHSLGSCTLQVVHGTHLLVLQGWQILGQFAESIKQYLI